MRYHSLYDGNEGRTSFWLRLSDQCYDENCECSTHFNILSDEELEQLLEEARE